MAQSQGGRLLDCINEPLKADPEYNMTHDEQENVATVQRWRTKLTDAKIKNEVAPACTNKCPLLTPIASHLPPFPFQTPRSAG